MAPNPKKSIVTNVPRTEYRQTVNIKVADMSANETIYFDTALVGWEFFVQKRKKHDLLLGVSVGRDFRTAMQLPPDVEFVVQEDVYGIDEDEWKKVRDLKVDQMVDQCAISWDADGRHSVTIQFALRFNAPDTQLFPLLEFQQVVYGSIGSWNDAEMVDFDYLRTRDFAFKQQADGEPLLSTRVDPLAMARRSEFFRGLFRSADESRSIRVEAPSGKVLRTVCHHYPLRQWRGMRDGARWGPITVWTTVT